MLTVTTQIHQPIAMEQDFNDNLFNLVILWACWEKFDKDTTIKYISDTPCLDNLFLCLLILFSRFFVLDIKQRLDSL